MPAPDAALARNADGQPLPGIAPVAKQQGAYVARVTAARAAGKEPRPFRYHDSGLLATIGRRAADYRSFIAATAG
ncbi:hypothetical protein [Allomesorhizobium camelthorni]|uniref:Uncharacterized protein n=1 Tax=Allomesorhizobium camelthorni TaxID=475069 RepID=A0A6G4WL26_9HYPH|nr:hypothetical protein [Mesorhizobium camelthorni]NGO55471.1 hypothetical protein [Mesorhizobium camelthorni]